MGIKVLWIYPNTYGMYMIPPAVALLSAILKKQGHKSEIFDLTFYASDHGIDSDGSKEDRLTVVPFKAEMEKRNLRRGLKSWYNLRTLKKLKLKMKDKLVKKKP